MREKNTDLCGVKEIFSKTAQSLGSCKVQWTLGKSLGHACEVFGSS